MLHIYTNTQFKSYVIIGLTNMFGNITNINNVNTLLTYITAALVVEVIMISLFRLTRSPFSGESINEW